MGLVRSEKIRSGIPSGKCRMHQIVIGMNMNTMKLHEEDEAAILAWIRSQKKRQ